MTSGWKWVSVSCITAQVVETSVDQFKFQENCPPTPPLSYHFATSEKQVSMLT